MASPKKASRPSSARKPGAEALRRKALDMGAKHAVLVNPRDVVTGEWVRLKCQYGCGGYGCCLTCPPHSPLPAQTRRLLDEYKSGLLIHSDGPRAWRTSSDIARKLEREAFLAGFYKAFSFLSGPCSLCKECPVEEGCRRPEEARPSMEAAGIDVFATARKQGLPIEVVTSRDCPQNYYALVLIE